MNIFQKYDTQKSFSYINVSLLYSVYQCKKYVKKYQVPISVQLDNKSKIAYHVMSDYERKTNL